MENYLEYTPSKPKIITIIDIESHMIGDSTITKICSFEPEIIEIEDAISYIIKEKSTEEMGDIIVKDKKNEIIATFSYNKGIITGQNGDLPKQTKVRLTRSNGGWGFMDYDLVVVE